MDVDQQVSGEAVTDPTEDVLAKWQSALDLMAEIVGVPVALVMRLRDDELEVFLASRSQGNPYQPGHREPWQGSGLYCEQVIREREKLLVPDATASERWRNNPDIALGMISYLGYPLVLPDGQVFGTICVLDSQHNAYSPRCEALLRECKELIESHLALARLTRDLERTRDELTARLAEIKTLQGLLPICSFCKRIRDEAGRWQSIEEYVTPRSSAEFTHSLCPSCLEKNYPQ